MILDFFKRKYKIENFFMKIKTCHARRNSKWVGPSQSSEEVGHLLKIKIHSHRQFWKISHLTIVSKIGGFSTWSEFRLPDDDTSDILSSQIHLRTFLRKSPTRESWWISSSKPFHELYIIHKSKSVESDIKKDDSMRFCVRKIGRVLVRILMCIWYDSKVKFLDFWCPVDPWICFNLYDGLWGSFWFDFEKFETWHIFLGSLKKIFFLMSKIPVLVHFYSWMLHWNGFENRVFIFLQEFRNRKFSSDCGVVDDLLFIGGVFYHVLEHFKALLINS